MKIGFRLAGLLLSLAGSHAMAQTVTPALHLDLDANPATGCTVATAAGTVVGAEIRLQATVGGDPLSVQSVTRATCVGNTFGAAQAQPAGYPVGIDLGSSGADVIELSTALDGLGDGGTAIAFFAVDGGNGEAELVQTTITLPGVVEPGTDAVPVIVPATGWLALLLLIGIALWAVRRHPAFGSTFAVILLMGSGIAWAANFIADGQIFDWNGEAPIATDPPNGGDPRADILAVFAATENGRLHVRFDVRDLEATPPANAVPTLADAAFALDENSAAGSAVGTVTGNDSDTGQVLTYAITGGNTGNTFAIDAASGAITVANPAALDAETTPNFVLTVTVSDDGDPVLDASASVAITVNDVNEAPIIDDQAFNISEHAANGALVGAVVASDPDATAPNATLSYAITAGNTGNAFAVDAASGAITIADAAAVTLDNAPFALMLQVSDGGSPALQADATVTIDVGDENDAPVFAAATYAFAIDEHSAAATPVGTVSATDADTADVLAYAISAGNAGNTFAIDAATGAITVANPAALDAETTSNVVLTVSVSDDDASPLSDTTTVTVTVDDVNEAPTLADAAFVVAENAAVGTPVGSVAATDPDAGAPFATLGYAITAGNDDGTFAIDATSGAITVADAALLDFESGATFVLSVRVTDGGGLDDDASVAITPSDVNEAPTLADTTRTVLQDSAAGTPVGAPLLATDPDAAAAGHTLAYAITAGNSGNAFSIDTATGQLRVAASGVMTAGASFTLTVVVTDNGGLAASATVVVAVTDVNDAPSFTAGPSQTVLEDAGPQSLPWATAIDDNDPGTQQLSFVVGNDNPALFATPPAIDAAGVLSYETAANANGSATVTVVLEDDGGTADGGVDTSAPQAFTITVTPVNDAPSFVAGADQTVAEDAATVTVAGWVTAISPGPADEAGQSVTFVVTSDNGGLFEAPVTVTPDGTLSFTPVADAYGVANVSIHAVDDGGIADAGEDTSATQMVTITVGAEDDPPVAVDDAFSMDEDAGAVAFDVLGNDGDIDGGPIAIASVVPPANGTVVVAGDGSSLTYTADANYCNSPSGTPDSFDYTLAPGGSSATVSVTVFCSDDPPVAVADSIVVTEDDAATPIDVLDNDTDVDAGPIAIASITQPANGTAVLAAGVLTYAPDADYCNSESGTPDTFTYTLTPGSSSTTVSVSVTCVDDAPVAVDDSVTVAEDAAATVIDVLANDSDIDAGPIAIDAIVAYPDSGSVVVVSDSELTYQPEANYCNSESGPPVTFSYSLAPGGSTATVSVTVECFDNAPVAVADAFTLVEDAGPTSLDVLGNDTDIDGGPISIASATQPANGTVVVAGSGLMYVPIPDYCNTAPGNTPDTFTYTLAPGGSTATVSVTVTCVDDNPVAVDDTAAVTEDSGQNVIDVFANDTDVDGGPRTIMDFTQPVHGIVGTNVEGTSLSYRPHLNYCNTSPGTPPDTFTYTLTPGGSTATVSVTVTCVDDNPVAVPDTAFVTEDAWASAVDVLSNDTDVDDGPMAIVSATQPANGVVVVTGGGTGLSYQPNANYCNDTGVPDTFTYTLTPGGSTTTVSVTVGCVDDRPVAVGDTATVTEDSGATAIDVLLNDTDIDGGAKTIQSVVQPGNGTVVITNGGHGLTYQPNPNYCNSLPGSLFDTFGYFLSPGGSSATVTVIVTCVDDSPVAVPDTATVVEDAGATAINVLANDTDVDGGSISIALIFQPANGTVVITGGGTGLTYQPAANYCNTPPGAAPDTFTYLLTPGGSMATVSVAVTCVDDNPVAVADSASVAIDAGPTTIDVLANDTDIDGGLKSIQAVTQPANGIVVVTNGGAALTYQPNPGYCNNPPGTARDSFTYTLTPGGSATTVSMTVQCVAAVTIVSDGGGDSADLDFPSLASLPVTDVDAIAPGGSPAIAYSLAGGADQARFSIDTVTGVLGFTTAPNAANPADADEDNVYEVIVQASNGVQQDTQTLRVTIVEGLRVIAKRVVVLRPGETTNLDVRVVDADGNTVPGAPYEIAFGGSAVSISPTGQVTVNGAGQSDTTVTITSPGYVPWTAWIAVRDVIDITVPHLSNQSISSSDGFSAFGSNQGSPSTSYYADIFRVHLQAGDVEITMDSGDDLDTYLLLADANGFLVAGNDDDDEGTLGNGSRLRYTVPADGIYFIEASTFNGLDTGNYAFSVTWTAPPPVDIDVGAFAIHGTCGILGIPGMGPGFLLTAGPTQPLPAGTTITIVGSGIANIGNFAVTGGTASVATLSGTSRLITLTAALPAGATLSARTDLSISVAFTLNGSTSLPGGYIGTGGKAAGNVTSTLVLCSAS